MSKVDEFQGRVSAAVERRQRATKEQGVTNTSAWFDGRIVFSASRDGYRMQGIELTGPAASFERGRDLRAQAEEAVADWADRALRIHGHRYERAEIAYVELQTPDGRFLDATKAGWDVLGDSEAQSPPVIKHGRTENPLAGPYYVVYMRGDRVRASVTGIQDAKSCQERAEEYAVRYGAPIVTPQMEEAVDGDAQSIDRPAARPRM